MMINVWILCHTVSLNHTNKSAMWKHVPSVFVLLCDRNINDFHHVTITGTNLHEEVVFDNAITHPFLLLEGSWGQ